jgi:hypothetical protein
MMITSGAFRKLALAAVALAGVLGFAGAASASTWGQEHPRRVEVNRRLNHQANRIADQELIGNLSPRRAAHLLHADNQVRREERLMASQNRGHITRLEQRALNQQENRIGDRIP